MGVVQELPGGDGIVCECSLRRLAAAASVASIVEDHHIAALPVPLFNNRGPISAMPGIAGEEQYNPFTASAVLGAAPPALQPRLRSDVQIQLLDAGRIESDFLRHHKPRVGTVDQSPLQSNEQHKDSQVGQAQQKQSTPSELDESHSQWH